MLQSDLGITNKKREVLALFFLALPAATAIVGTITAGAAAGTALYNTLKGKK